MCVAALLYNKTNIRQFFDCCVEFLYFERRIVMSEQDIRDMRELDELAEKAGGYVADPREVKYSKKMEEDFHIMRQY